MDAGKRRKKRSTPKKHKTHSAKRGTHDGRGDDDSATMRAAAQAQRVARKASDLENDMTSVASVAQTAKTISRKASQSKPPKPDEWMQRDAATATRRQASLLSSSNAYRAPLARPRLTTNTSARVETCLDEDLETLLSLDDTDVVGAPSFRRHESRLRAPAGADARDWPKPDEPTHLRADENDQAGDRDDRLLSPRRNGAAHESNAFLKHAAHEQKARKASMLAIKREIATHTPPRRHQLPNMSRELRSPRLTMLAARAHSNERIVSPGRGGGANNGATDAVESSAVTSTLSVPSDTADAAFGASQSVLMTNKEVQRRVHAYLKRRPAGTAAFADIFKQFDEHVSEMQLTHVLRAICTESAEHGVWTLKSMATPPNRSPFIAKRSAANAPSGGAVDVSNRLDAASYMLLEEIRNSAEHTRASLAAMYDGNEALADADVRQCRALIDASREAMHTCKTTVMEQHEKLFELATEFEICEEDLDYLRRVMGRKRPRWWRRTLRSVWFWTLLSVALAVYFYRSRYCTCLVCVCLACVCLLFVPLFVYPRNFG